jgi:hypothetical protein
MKTAIVRVSPELLADALKFPKGTEILACRREYFFDREIELVVSHDDLQEVPKGSGPLHASPEFRDDSGNWEFLNWGQS